VIEMMEEAFLGERRASSQAVTLRQFLRSNIPLLFYQILRRDRQNFHVMLTRSICASTNGLTPIGEYR
jgi:hypothetical protein